MFQQGVQEYPLSPLLFGHATTSVPTRVVQDASDTKSAQFADDYSLYNEAFSPESAAAIQLAFDSVISWASDHYMLIKPSKTEGSVISLDPRETASKAQPALLLESTLVPFNRYIKILGVNIDTQLTFSEHTSIIVKKMSERTQLLSILPGKNWSIASADFRRLQRLCQSGAIYASEVWGSFSLTQIGTSKKHAAIEL